MPDVGFMESRTITSRRSLADRGRNGTRSTVDGESMRAGT